MLEDEGREDLVRRREEPPVIERPESEADREEEEELAEHHEAGADDGALRILERARRHEPLHDQLGEAAGAGGLSMATVWEAARAEQVTAWKAEERERGADAGGKRR